MRRAAVRAWAWGSAIAVAAPCGCGRGSSATVQATSTTSPTDQALVAPVRGQQMHSGSLAIDPGGSRLFVVHPDADSVSVLDVARRTIIREVALSSPPPAIGPAGRYEPAVSPRALALDATGGTLYVTGQRSGRVYAIDVASASVKAQAVVCSEPVGVLVGADDATVFVACAQDDAIVKLRASDLSVLGTAPCPRKPWALAWAADGRTLLATHFLGPGVSVFATSPLALRETWSLADGPPKGSPGSSARRGLPRAGPRKPPPSQTASPRKPGASSPMTDGTGDPMEPHGQVRGLYDALVRPGTSELWVAHVMLGTDTPQPALDFQRTVFPAVSILDVGGQQVARLSVQVHPGDGGAFADVVSGPHALAFSPDGALAFVVDSDSEDVLVVDATRRVQAALVRPLPGHLPEGIVWANGEVYVQERNTEDIAAFRVTQRGGRVSVETDGRPFASLSADPMPPTLRLGQKLYFSANSDDVPVTQNHWIACASCHLEGRSDAVTWRFTQGPRDTPTNAGGLRDTGFLFRTADRTQVQDYWRTIDVEQGGHFQIAEPSQRLLLDALADYVNDAIPTPVPPSTDATHTVKGAELAALRARGEATFERVGCGRCHSGPAKTDSGDGNPGLDLGGPVVSTSMAGGVLLHDVGTCVTSGPAPDVKHEDFDGEPRAACAFDTPALRGLWDSAPYLHDGSAATLDDVLPSMLRASAPTGATPEALSADEAHALVEYLRGL